MKPATIKSIGTLVALALAAGANVATDPLLQAWLYSSCALLCGWLHIPRPGDVRMEQGK